MEKIQTFKHLQNLSQIPHRGVGTKEIQLAENYIKESIPAGKYSILTQQITTIKRGFFIVPLITSFILLATLVFLLLNCKIFTALALLIGFLNFLQPKWVLKIYSNLLPVRTRNIFAVPKDINKTKPTIVLTAHYDTTPETLYLRHIVLKLSNVKSPTKPKIPILFSIFLPIYITFIILLFSIFFKNNLYFVTTPVIILSTVYSLSGLFTNYVNGALDNGSSVSVVLSLMNNTFKNFNLIILFSTAEENYIRGVEYVDEILIDNLHLSKDNIYFVNLECLGCKNIIFASSESDDIGLRIKNYQANSLITKFISDSKLKSGHLPLATDMCKIISNGYKVITTVISFDEKFIKSYHSKSDRIEAVDETYLKNAEDLVASMLQMIDVKVKDMI